jgi:septation ring formation regulator EzrA
MENRIDRIERYIEEFAKGMTELKESQQKTDAQQNRTDDQLRETIKEFRATQKLLGDLGLVQGVVAESPVTHYPSLVTGKRRYDA